MVSACSVDTHSSDSRRFPRFGISILQRHLYQLTRTTVVVPQGALVGDADPLHSKAMALTEASLLCRCLVLRSALRVPQVGPSAGILTALVKFLFHPPAEHHNQDQPQADRRSNRNRNDFGMFPITPIGGNGVRVRRTWMPRESGSPTGKHPSLCL